MSKALNTVWLSLGRQIVAHLPLSFNTGLLVDKIVSHFQVHLSRSTLNNQLSCQTLFSTHICLPQKTYEFPSAGFYISIFLIVLPLSLSITVLSLLTPDMISKTQVFRGGLANILLGTTTKTVKIQPPKHTIEGSQHDRISLHLSDLSTI